MGRNTRPVNGIDFLDDLPEYYARYAGNDSFRRFLMQFEAVFEGLQSSIVGNALTLTYVGPGRLKPKDDPDFTGYPLVVELFDAGHLGYPKGALVQIPGEPKNTLLAQPVEADSENLTLVYVTDSTFSGRLVPGGRLVVSTGSGITGLTSIRQMPPVNYRHLGEKAKLDYLQYLASWVGLPLRSDKLLSWNRRFLRNAVKLTGNRSTLPGLTEMLNCWHHEEVAKNETVVTDLTAPENGVDTVFRLGESRIGIDTMLGEGQKGHFYVHLTADPTDVTMRKPQKMAALENAARLMLELEKPTNTEYTLRIHSRTMQLAPDPAIAPYKQMLSKRAPESAPEEELTVKDTNTFARVGITTLLWND
ncbi:MAG: hypothetical protein FWG06_00020 [Clostridiales bacterium]|nr:hypothetical protein [Clostridiales bacterium]